MSKKHTFLANADSKSSTIDSYKNIAQAVRLAPRPLESANLCDAVKNWLEYGTKGPWIMSVDGLESQGIANDIKNLLTSL